MFDRVRILLGPHEGPIARLMEGAHEQSTEPGRAAFQPGLGNRMRQQHAALVEAFRRVLDEHWRRNYVGCLAALRRFARVLEEYLANDEVMLEASMAAPDPDGESGRFAELRALRERLRHLARQSREYSALAPSHLRPPGRVDYGIVFLGMSKTLRDCLDAEEARLPLYRARGESAVPEASGTKGR